MIGPALRSVLASAGFLFLLLVGEVRGHIPDTIVIELELKDRSWVAKSEMDVRFALTTLMRHYLPPDSGVSWVENLSPGQLGLIKEVTEELYRERFQLSIDGRPLEMEVGFPDYDQTPLKFHPAASGEAMTTVVMRGALPSAGELKVRWEGRWGPALVLSVLPPEGGDPAIHTLALGESATLGGSGPAAVQGAPQLGWAGWLRCGFAHLLPLGPVHALFILGFVLLVPRRQDLVLQGACFTLGHSLTLWLVGLGVVAVPSGVIEPLLALSIVYIGIDNLFLRKATSWRLGMVSGFGLLHGIGLALVVRGLGRPGRSMLSPLSGFHLGVELGQVVLIGAALLLALPILARKSFGKVRVLGSATIAAIGLFWTVELVVR